MKLEFSLEDITEGPMYAAPEESEAIVETGPVDESDIQDATLSASDDLIAVESAAAFIRYSLEHVSVISSIVASSTSSEAFKVEHTSTMEKTMGNIWKAIVAAFKRLVDMISKFVTKVVNFARSGGVKEKIAYIGSKASAVDFKKIDGNKKVLDTAVIDDCLKLKGFKVPENFFEKIGDGIFGVDPTKIRADATESAKKQVRIADAFSKAKGVATSANLEFFTKGLEANLKDARAAQKKVETAEKSKAEGDKEKTKKAAEASRVVLKKISDASFIGVRGFSWFLTIVNYTYGAIKASEGKSDKK